MKKSTAILKQTKNFSDTFYTSDDYKINVCLFVNTVLILIILPLLALRIL